MHYSGLGFFFLLLCAVKLLQSVQLAICFQYRVIERVAQRERERERH